MAKELLKTYVQLATLVAKMLERARAKEWEMLPQMDSQCDQFVRRLKQLHEHEQLEPAERAKAQELIRKVQADQAQITELVQPQMDKLMENLQHLQRQKSLNSAYGRLT